MRIMLFVYVEILSVSGSQNPVPLELLVNEFLRRVGVCEFVRTVGVSRLPFAHSERDV